MEKTLLTTALLLGSTALAEQPVTINFAAEVDGTPFACSETYSDLGNNQTAVTFADFRLYAHDFELLDADGKATPITLDQDQKWQHETLALLDFEDASGGCTNGTKALNTMVKGHAPAGDYTGLRFTVGVPFADNHQDPTVADSPLNLTAMFWNWRAGYKFVRIDMVPTEKAADAPKGWFLHLGSTQCESGSKTEAPAAECKSPNRMTVVFDNFDASSQTIIVDPAKVIADVNLQTNTPETSPGCMSFPNDPDCDTVMTKLGLDFKDIAKQDQLLFSVR